MLKCLTSDSHFLCDRDPHNSPAAITKDSFSVMYRECCLIVSATIKTEVIQIHFAYSRYQEPQPGWSHKTTTQDHRCLGSSQEWKISTLGGHQVIMCCGVRCHASNRVNTSCALRRCFCQNILLPAACQLPGHCLAASVIK